MHDLIGEKSRYFYIAYFVMFPPCFHAGRGKDDPAFEYPLHAGGVQFGVVVGVLNDPAAVFLVFRRVAYCQNEVINRRDFFI